MAKLFVTTSDNGCITNGYSSMFMTPRDGDTCIANGSNIIHFQIDGEVNPELFDQNGIPLYKLVDGMPVLRTEEEIAADIAAMNDQ